MKCALRSKILRAVFRLASLAALLLVAVVMNASQCLARGQKHPVPSTRLDDPQLPVLYGGIVGPARDAGTGSVTESTLPHAARDTTADAMPGGQQARLVSPPAETWEQAAERNARLTGTETSNELDDGRSQRRRVAVALGLVGAIGILAVMAALRGADPRLTSKSPTSVLSSRAPDIQRPGGAGHERSMTPEVRQRAAPVRSQNP